MLIPRNTNLGPLYVHAGTYPQGIFISIHELSNDSVKVTRDHLAQLASELHQAVELSNNQDLPDFVDSWSLLALLDDFSFTDFGPGIDTTHLFSLPGSEVGANALGSCCRRSQWLSWRSKFAQEAYEGELYNCIFFQRLESNTFLVQFDLRNDDSMMLSKRDSVALVGLLRELATPQRPDEYAESVYADAITLRYPEGVPVVGPVFQRKESAP